MVHLELQVYTREESLLVTLVAGLAFGVCIYIYMYINIYTCTVTKFICTLFYRDLERIEAPVYSVKAHDQIVNAIDGVGGLGIGGGAPEIVTGSRDGK